MAENVHKFASTQVNLAGPVAEEMRGFARTIPDEEIDPTDGRESEPHVTVKYGLHTSSAADVARVLDGEPPITLSLGKTSIFPANDQRDSDVVKVDVTSPDLHRLNKKLADALPHTDTYPEYHPHATIAYVKPGVGKKYDGHAALEGKTFTLNHVVFSAQDGTKTDVPLTGKPPALPFSSVPVAYHLHLAGDPFKPAVTLGQGWPATEAGQPCTYLKKDVIRSGRFVHPVKGFEVPVDRKRIDAWVNTFNAFQRNGVKVPLPMDHSTSAKDNLGKVVAMERDGDRLMAVCQFIGDDAARIGARNEVSVGIDPNFKDGEGREYGDAIVHVAITPYPVVPGQGGFQAASRAAAGDVLTLAAAPEPKESPMSDRMLKCSDEHLNSLQTLVPGLKDVPDEQLLARVVQHLSAVASADDEDAGGPDKVATLSREQIATTAKANRTAMRSDLSRLTADNTQLRQQVQELSGRVVKPLDAEAHLAIRESAQTKLENAVARGGISPATKDRLAGLLLGTKDAPNTLALSRAANPTGDKALALSILDVLVDNRPVETGERTGLQALARVAPGGEEKTSAEQAQTMLLAAANRYAPATK